MMFYLLELYSFFFSLHYNYINIINIIDLGEIMSFKVEYINEKIIDFDDSKTILENSLFNEISHMHACGGHARCSTCRVIVLEGEENLCSRNQEEAKLADKKGFQNNIRLACQTKITGPIKVRRLILDEEDAILATNRENNHPGTQEDLIVMFTDIRNFTPFVESNYDYDVVHILNRYFFEIGESVVKYNGNITNYMGDGMMILFGEGEKSIEEAGKEALKASFAMLEQLEIFNKYLNTHFNHSFGMGIGIHRGKVITGKIGHPKTITETAIGNIVNVSSRIEAETKNFGSNILISEEFFKLTKKYILKSKTHTVSLKGISKPVKLYEPLGIKVEQQKESKYEQLVGALKDLMGKTKAPAYLRLAWHDAIMYNPKTKKGGADGSIRFDKNINNEKNRSLTPILKDLEKVKTQFPDISWADIIAVAGSVAVEVTGGPVIPMKLGRIDKEFEEDLQEPPSDNISPKDSIRYFKESGFSVKEMIVLLGGHTLG